MEQLSSIFEALVSHSTIHNYNTDAKFPFNRVILAIAVLAANLYKLVTTFQPFSIFFLRVKEYSSPSPSHHCNTITQFTPGQHDASHSMDRTVNKPSII